MNRKPLVAIYSLLLFGFAGCFSGEDSSQGITGKEKQAPLRFEKGGQTWNKEGLPDEKQKKLLEQYLNKNSSIVENPLIKGVPSLYSNGKGHVRFYWFQQNADEVNWLYIEFEEDQFVSLDEGLSPQDEFQ